MLIKKIIKCVVKEYATPENIKFISKHCSVTINNKKLSTTEIETYLTKLTKYINDKVESKIDKIDQNKVRFEENKNN